MCLSFPSHAGERRWLPDLAAKAIPLREGLHPLQMLTNDSQVAEWQNERLPSDQVSVENGGIITQVRKGLRVLSLVDVSNIQLRFANPSLLSLAEERGGVRGNRGKSRSYLVGEEWVPPRDIADILAPELTLCCACCVSCLGIPKRVCWLAFPSCMLTHSPSAHVMGVWPSRRDR